MLTSVGGLLEMSTAGEELNGSEKLDGWKEIADFLDISERTARNWSHTRNLPVHRFHSSERSRVWAVKGELIGWLASQEKAGQNATRLAAPGPGPSAPTQSEVNDTSPQLVRAADSRRKVIGAGVVAVVAVASAFAALRPEADIFDFEVKGQQLIALDSGRRELWRHTFPWTMRDNAYAELGRDRHAWVGKLAGKSVLLFNAIPFNRTGNGTPLVCFDRRGKQLWEFSVARTVADKDGNTFAPPFHPSAFLVVDGRAPSETRIVVSSNHYAEYPNPVSVLDASGKLIGEYWHPGHLQGLAQADLDGTGRHKIILAGVNNGEHTATLIVLDPLSITGVTTVTELTDGKFALAGMPAAKETGVVLFPRSCLSQGQRYTRVRDLIVSNSRIIAITSESPDATSPGFAYEFDYRLRLLTVAAWDDRIPGTHEKMERAGLLDHRYEPKREFEELRAAVKIRVRQ